MFLLTWSRPFIPSLAVAPPADNTFLKVPAWTRDAALTIARPGAAQKPRTSQPVALTTLASLPMDFAKLPPPLVHVAGCFF